ncbi:hypothetical protein ACB098_07G047400 [Castanea mollissima]
MSLPKAFVSSSICHCFLSVKIPPNVSSIALAASIAWFGGPSLFHVPCFRPTELSTVERAKLLTLVCTPNTFGLVWVWRIFNWSVAQESEISFCEVVDLGEPLLR